MFASCLIKTAPQCTLIVFLSLFWNVLLDWSHPNFTIPTYKSVDSTEIKEALIRYEIIPDVIPRAPSHYVMIQEACRLMLLVVGFQVRLLHCDIKTEVSHEHKNCTPKLGNILDPNLLDCFPFQVQWPTEKGKLYTLLMIDPDYPSRENRSLGAFQHWMIGNIPDQTEDYPLPDIFEAKLLTRYLGPNPRPGTGLHRYTFLVYEQRGKIRFKEPDLEIEEDDPKRMNFSTRVFSRKYRLSLHAVSFYLCEWVKGPPSTTYEPWDFTPETEGPDVGGNWTVDEKDLIKVRRQRLGGRRRKKS